MTNEEIVAANKLVDEFMCNHRLPRTDFQWLNSNAICFHLNWELQIEAWKRAIEEVRQWDSQIHHQLCNAYMQGVNTNNKIESFKVLIEAIAVIKATLTA